jgi:predicted nucleotidyltransferase
MNLSSLVFQQQNRYKFWNWDEVFTYTNLTPTEIKEIIDSQNYQLQDPFSALVYSHKNHEIRALDNLFMNYAGQEKFKLGYSECGVSANFVLQSQSPTWQNYNHNTDWYWKQNWIYKHGQILQVFPGVRNIYLSCSAALENSHHGSDIDLIIKTHKNMVWITKAYFAVLSKVLKYYNLNFSLAIFYHLTRQNTKLEYLKHKSIENKIKIDFGLVFEDEKALTKNYSNLERNIFVWSALKLETSNKSSNNSVILSQAQNPVPVFGETSKVSKGVEIIEEKFNKFQNASNPPDRIFHYAQDNKIFGGFKLGQAGSIVYKQKINPTVFKSIQILLFPTIMFIAPFGILNYWYEQKNRSDYNKLVLWKVYSQYNLVY